MTDYAEGFTVPGLIGRNLWVDLWAALRGKNMSARGFMLEGRGRPRGMTHLQ